MKDFSKITREDWETAQAERDSAWGLVEAACKAFGLPGYSDFDFEMEAIAKRLSASDSRVQELESVLESNAKVLKTGLQTSIKNMHIHEALKSSHELLCILRTAVEFCDEEINPDWTYEEFGKKVHTLLSSTEVYEDLHVDNERALLKAESATVGGSVGND